MCWRVSSGGRACIHEGQSHFQSYRVLQKADFNSTHVLTLTLKLSIQGKIVEVKWVRLLPCHEPTPSWKVVGLFTVYINCLVYASRQHLRFSSLFTLCSCCLACSHYLFLCTGSISIQRHSIQCSCISFLPWLIQACPARKGH